MPADLEQRAFLVADQLGVVVAERELGLEVELGLETGRLVGKRLLDLRQQIAAAIEELDRFVELVDQLALRIGERPDQRHDARGSDVHQGMIA
jgi:hypothetical protein